MTDRCAAMSCLPGTTMTGTLLILGALTILDALLLGFLIWTLWQERHGRPWRGRITPWPHRPRTRRSGRASPYSVHAIAARIAAEPPLTPAQPHHAPGSRPSTEPAARSRSKHPMTTTTTDPIAVSGSRPTSARPHRTTRLP
ncbi:MAG: hypothetical protein ACRDRL_14985 [Sciscionella sp.]